MFYSDAGIFLIYKGAVVKKFIHETVSDTPRTWNSPLSIPPLIFVIFFFHFALLVLLVFLSKYIRHEEDHFL